MDGGWWPETSPCLHLCWHLRLLLPMLILILILILVDGSQIWMHFGSYYSEMQLLIA